MNENEFHFLDIKSFWQRWRRRPCDLRVLQIIDFKGGILMKSSKRVSMLELSTLVKELLGNNGFGGGSFGGGSFGGGGAGGSW